MNVLAELLKVFSLSSVYGHGDGVVEFFVLCNLDVEFERPDGVAFGALAVGTFHLNIVPIKKHLRVIEPLWSSNRESLLHGLIGLLVTAGHVHLVRGVDNDLHVHDVDRFALLERKWRVVSSWVGEVALLPRREAEFDLRIEFATLFIL